MMLRRMFKGARTDRECPRKSGRKGDNCRLRGRDRPYLPPSSSEQTLVHSNRTYQKVYEVEIDIKPNISVGIVFAGSPPQVTCYEPSLVPSSSKPSKSLVRYFLVSLTTIQVQEPPQSSAEGELLQPAQKVTVFRDIQSADELHALLLSWDHCTRHLVLSPYRPLAAAGSDQRTK